MKRLLSLVMACVFVLSSTCTAGAVEAKFSGQWLFSFGVTENVNKLGGSFASNKNRKVNAGAAEASCED